MRLVSPRLRSADWKNMLFAVCETISGIDSSLFRQKAAAEYLLSCRSFYLLFQRFLNFFDHDPKRLQPCIFLIYGFQNVPWCISSAGFLKHLIYCCFILIPFFTVSPVLIRDLPLFSGLLWRSLNLASWVSLSMWTQNFTITAPQSESSFSNSLISL